MKDYPPNLKLLAEMLEVVLPSELQTLVLRASLLQGSEVREEWAQWVRVTPQARCVLGGPAGLKRLLALLYYGLQRNEVPLEQELRTYLRAAWMREQMRTEAVRRICREVFTCLAGRGLPVVVVKGILAAETVYPEAFLRHSHDLDLLVEPERLTEAVVALAAAGLKRAEPAPRGQAGSAFLVHESGFPVSLHTRLFRPASFNAGCEDIPQRLVPATVAGVAVQTLAPAGNLLHICGHAATVGSYASPCWAADAWFLIQRQAGLDWGRLLAAAEDHLALPLSVTLGYLATGLDAPVPAEVLDGLRTRAVAAGGASRAAARLAVTLSTAPRPLEPLRRSRGWRARLLAARWSLWPVLRSCRLFARARAD